MCLQNPSMLSFPIVNKRKAKRLFTARATGHPDNQISLCESSQIAFVVNFGQDTAASPSEFDEVSYSVYHRLRRIGASEVDALLIGALHQHGIDHVCA